MQNMQSDLHLTGNKKSEDTNGNQGTVHITNISDSEISIKVIDFDYDNFQVNLPDKIMAGETVQGKISLLDMNNDKTFYKSLTIEVNDEKKTRYTIPVVYNSKVMSQK